MSNTMTARQLAIGALALLGTLALLMMGHTRSNTMTARQLAIGAFALLATLALLMMGSVHLIGVSTEKANAKHAFANAPASIKEIQAAAADPCFKGEAELQLKQEKPSVIRNRDLERIVSICRERVAEVSVVAEQRAILAAQRKAIESGTSK
jgi:hypothetical protein